MMKTKTKGIIVTVTVTVTVLLYCYLLHTPSSDVDDSTYITWCRYTGNTSITMKDFTLLRDSGLLYETRDEKIRLLEDEVKLLRSILKDVRRKKHEKETETKEDR